MCGSQGRERWRVFHKCFLSGLHVCRMTLPPCQCGSGWVPRMPLGGAEHHPRTVRGWQTDIILAWNTRFWAICQWPEILSFIWLPMLLFFLWFRSKTCTSVQCNRGDAYFSLALSFVKSYPEQISNEVRKTTSVFMCLDVYDSLWPFMIQPSLRVWLLETTGHYALYLFIGKYKHIHMYVCVYIYIK